MLYTIGTSNRSLCDFLSELKRRNITCIIDVRSKPYSRMGHFCRPAIKAWAPPNGLFYREEGLALGGRSQEGSNSVIFREALTRLHVTSARESVAIFCAEGDPALCHRSYLVAVAYFAMFRIEPINILRDGSDELVTKTIERTIRGPQPLPLSEMQRPLPF